MAKASEQFQQSDVTLWGMVALVCGAIAVLSANLSAVVPQNILASLHQTRIEGASLDQLRIQVAGMREETSRLQRENNTLLTRFALQDQAGSEVIQRIGALEVSLPRLLENLPASIGIDRSAQTASITNGGTQILNVDGGSISIQQRPLEALPAVLDQAMPAPIKGATAVPNQNAFGVAIGPAITPAQAPERWSDLSNKLGPLLLGLSPLLADEANGDGKRILVGPITELSQATELCARLERVSVSCMPLPFTGAPLAL